MTSKAWVVAVVGLKGGVGKSTVSITLATTLHAAGHRVLIADCDPQGTARAWAARAAELGHEGPAVVSLDGRQLRRDLDRLAVGVDLVVIDTPPRLGPDARAAMMVADLIVLPTIPGAADMWALQETIAVLREVEGSKDVKAAVVLNRDDRTTLARVVRDTVSALDVPLFPCSLSTRVAFGEAILTGRGVVDSAPSSAAAKEARALTQAVLAMLGETNGKRKKSHG